MARRRGRPLTIWLDDNLYALLRAYCDREEYASLPECAASLIASALRGEAHAAGGQGASFEAALRRVERAVQDLLNPYTAKLDEITRRLAEIYEILESIAAPERAPAAAQPPTPRTSLQRERGRRGQSAIERLRKEGVFFEEDAGWLRAPEKFFQKLEREGALVLQLHGEHVAVDPDFWRDFVEVLETVEASGLDEAVEIISDQLGERAGRLLEKLARAGLAFYDEAAGRWRVSERINPHP